MKPGEEKGRKEGREKGAGTATATAWQSEKLLPSSCFHYMRLGNLEWPADKMKANLEL